MSQYGTVLHEVPGIHLPHTKVFPLTMLFLSRGPDHMANTCPDVGVRGRVPGEGAGGRDGLQQWVLRTPALYLGEIQVRPLLHPSSPNKVPVDYRLK